MKDRPRLRLWRICVCDRLTQSPPFAYIDQTEFPERMPCMRLLRQLARTGLDSAGRYRTQCSRPQRVAFTRQPPPITSNAGIQSQTRPSVQCQPASRRAAGMHHSTHATFFALKSSDAEFGIQQSLISPPNFYEPAHKLYVVTLATASQSQSM